MRDHHGTSGVTLTNCEREQIHIPGAIQDFGFLLVANPATLEIEMASINSEQFLGLKIGQIVERRLLDFIRVEDRSNIQEIMNSPDVSSQNPVKVTLNTSRGFLKFDCLLSASQDFVLLEFEAAPEESVVDFKSFYHLATRSVEKIRSAQTIASLQQITVDEIRRITGFDRVVIYRFDSDWNGVVPAESRSEHVTSYLDLHFPASDIPKQVREMYAKNPLRIIPNVAYTPSQIFSRELGAEKNLDLSLTSLRNVSPIHVEYLNNMGVKASMSTSIKKNGKLWGLVSCSHESRSNYVSYEKRAVCIFLAATLSSLLPYFEDREDVQLRDRLARIQNTLVVRMTESTKFLDGLFNDPADLLALTNATGVAAYFDQEWRVHGKTPSRAVMDKIRDLIAEKELSSGFATDALGSLLKETHGISDVASGVLGFSISKSKTNYILWFRPEVLQTVKWGGNPNKPVELKNDEQILHPRKSFELWKETVRHKSLPWRKEEIEVAQQLRSSITDVVLQRVEQVTKLNSELEKSNVELDSFAYAASHDLKEPLRGISNYTAMVLRESSETLSNKSKERMETVLRLTQRAEGLINSLLGYSKVGRIDLIMEPVSLDEVVATAMDTLRTFIEKNNAVVEVGNLPTVMADRTQLSEVFTNLIVNGIKYNSSNPKKVEISRREMNSKTNSTFIAVRDNGIGIAPEFHQSIFKIFKRLHGKDEFGGGSGTGLTIVQKIVERHGGCISVESSLKGGTTFLIELPVT